MPALVINTWSSHCGKCGGKAFPEDTRCKACGEYDAFSTDYMGFVEDSVRKMRPDLPFVGAMERLGR